MRKGLCLHVWRRSTCNAVPGGSGNGYSVCGTRSRRPCSLFGCSRQPKVPQTENPPPLPAQLRFSDGPVVSPTTPMLCPATASHCITHLQQPHLQGGAARPMPCPTHGIQYYPAHQLLLEQRGWVAGGCLLGFRLSGTAEKRTGTSRACPTGSLLSPGPSAQRSTSPTG